MTYMDHYKWDCFPRQGGRDKEGSKREEEMVFMSTKQTEKQTSKNMVLNVSRGTELASLSTKAEVQITFPSPLFVTGLKIVFELGYNSGKKRKRKRKREG